MPPLFLGGSQLLILSSLTSSAAFLFHQEPEVLGAHHSSIDHTLIGLLQPQQQLFAWTVDEPAHLARVLDLGVDAVGA